MATGDLTGVDVEDDDDQLPAISRIGCSIDHKEIVAEWARYMIGQGFEVRVENVGNGVVEGVAW